MSRAAKLMTWHKWLVRGLVCTVFAAGVAGAAVYALWTSPAAVRRLVQEQVAQRFQRVAVQVGGARLRLLGGILVRELRLARTENLDRQDFLYAPAAVIYHDKETLLDGKMSVRKIELDNPQLRVIRERDGRFNLTGVLGPTDLSQPLPTVTVKGGSATVECRVAGLGSLLEVRNVGLTMINDPVPTLHIEGAGEVDVLGPVRFRLTVDRATMATQVELTFPAVPVGKELVMRIARYYPALGQHLEQLTGQAEITARFDLPGDGKGEPRHDVRFQLHHGRFHHPRLPAPFEQIEVAAHLCDGLVTEAKFTARSGPTDAELRLAGLDLCGGTNGSGSPGGRTTLLAEDLTERVKELDLSISRLPVDGDLIRRLPPSLHSAEKEYNPSGLANVRYKFRRPADGPLVKEWTIEPQGMSGTFAGFPCPVEDVRGQIWFDTSALPLRNVRMDLNGRVGGTRAVLRGTFTGDPMAGQADFSLAADGVLLDHRIMKALPSGMQEVVKQFLSEASRTQGLAARPLGRGNVRATFRRQPGSEKIESRIAVQIRQASILYDQFPYPLEEVSGDLFIGPGGWECRNFLGRHAGGEIRVEARSVRPPAAPGAGPPRVQVAIRGSNILLDHEFERALTPLGSEGRRSLQQTWRALQLSGRFEFSAEVTDTPGAPQNIEVGVNVRGCRLHPRFFDYDLEQLSAEVRYARNLVTVKNLQARHGPSRIALSSGLIQLNGEGGFTAWLNGLTGLNVRIDADLIRALPEAMRSGLESLRFQTPVNVATNLTLVSPGGSGGNLETWWEGALGVRQGRFKAGLDVADASGRFYCKGYHDGRKLRGVSGQVQLESCRVLDQPLTKLAARLEVEPRSPEVLRIRDVKANLFGGTAAGQARIEIGPVLRYDVLLEALGVDLEAFGKHNLGESAAQAQLQGPARAALHLVGEGTDLIGLKGNGRIDVPKGKMGQLPVLLDLLKAFGLRLPDRTAFEQALVVFSIEGPRMFVQQLDLFGNAVSLRGEGSLDLDGSNIELDFNATPGRFTQILPAGIDAIPQLISGQFFKIKMRGKLGKGGGAGVRFDKELIPGVVDPIRRVIGGEP